MYSYLELETKKTDAYSVLAAGRAWVPIQEKNPVKHGQKTLKSHEFHTLVEWVTESRLGKVAHPKEPALAKKPGFTP